MFYRICPRCGAALDPGERCDCNSDFPSVYMDPPKPPRPQDHTRHTEIKAFLASFRIERKKCIELLQDWQDLENPHVKSLSFTYSGNVRSSGTRTLDRDLMKIERAKERYARQLDKTVGVLERLWDVIDALSDYDMKTLMLLRYLYGKPWEIVAQEMDCSDPLCYRIHNEALEEIERRELLK